jgi:hypothetical protein
MAPAVGTKWFHVILQLMLSIGFHGLGLLARFVEYGFLHPPPPPSIIVSGLYMFIKFVVYIFPVISLRQSLVSRIYYIAVVIQTWAVVVLH